MEGQTFQTVLANLKNHMVSPVLDRVEVLSVAEVEKRGLSKLENIEDKYDETF